MQIGWRVRNDTDSDVAVFEKTGPRVDPFRPNLHLESRTIFVQPSVTIRVGTAGVQLQPIDTHRAAVAAASGIESKEGITVIILGIILALIGYFASISILTTIGIILVVVGAVLTILGATGNAIGGRKTFY